MIMVANTPYIPNNQFLGKINWKLEKIYSREDYTIIRQNVTSQLRVEWRIYP